MSWVMEAIRAEAVSSRMNRRMYWIAVVVLFAVVAIVDPKPTIRNGLIITSFWMFAYALRLHDIGRSAWWATLAVASMIVLIGIAADLAPNAFAEISGHWRGAPEQNAGVALSLTALAILVSSGFTIWLGVVRGEAGTNRFGVPIKGWRFLQPSPPEEKKAIGETDVLPGSRQANGAQTNMVEMGKAAGEGTEANDPGDGNVSPPRPLFDFRHVRNPWMRIPLQAGVVAGALGVALVAWIAAWQLITASGFAPWSRPLHGWVEDLKAKAGR